MACSTRRFPGESQPMKAARKPPRGSADVAVLGLLAASWGSGFIVAAIVALALAALLIAGVRRFRHAGLRTRERERWLATTLRGVSDGVVTTDGAGRITFLNPIAEKMCGWSEAEALDRRVDEIFQFVHTGSRQPIENPALAAIRSARTVTHGGPARLLARDGAERAIADDATPICNDRGDITGCVMVLRDVTDRELGDSALRASQEMFAMITNHVSDMIAVLDLQGRRLYNSASYQRLLASPSDLYLTDSFSNIHPEDRERIKQVFADTIHTGIGQRTTYRLIGKDGSEVHIESLGSVIRGADGKPNKVLVVSRDVTERHLSEERVMREKDFSDKLINSMPGIFYLYDPSRIILRWNKNFEAVTQYSAEEIGKLDPLDFFRADQKQLVHSRMVKCMTEGSADVEVFIVAKDGTQQPYYVTGRRVELDGRPCMLGVGIDITERLCAEEAVRATMRRLGRQNRALSEHARSSAFRETNAEEAFEKLTEIAAQTLELARSSIWLLDENSETIRCASIFDRDGKDGSRGMELVPAAYPEYFAALHHERCIAASDACGDPRTHELATDYFTPRDIASTLDAPIRSGGKMVGVLCNEQTGQARTWTPDEQNFAGSMADLVSLTLEVLQRKEAEEALREARDNLEIKVAERTRELEQANERLQELDRLKSEFLATMSHELRTPLNSIIGFTGILQQGLAGPLNAEQVKQLGMVHFSAKHLLGLINDLLDLSRIESGKMEVLPETFPLEEVVHEVVQSLTPTATQKKLRLEAQLDPAHLPLHSDRKKVFQILLNLVNNAVKFTEKGGVRVVISSADREVTIAVIDTGIGIQPESVRGLFQAFRQVDGSARRVYEGTGLGLYLCRKLSKLLGGSIHAESEFGVGSRFTVKLPNSP